MRRVLTEARRLGAVRATLEVRASNQAARRFYEAMGFAVTATRPRYYTDPTEDALILWRELSLNGGLSESGLSVASTLCYFAPGDPVARSPRERRVRP